MDVLVMLEEGPDQTPLLARIDSVPEALASERRARDVVTLFGTPSPESLSLALAAVVESRRANGGSPGAFQHLGVWPDRGAVGDTAWRDRRTGELMTRDLDIPFDTLAGIALRLRSEFGQLLQRLAAGLAMPDWPEGTWRAIAITFNPELLPAPALAYGADNILDVMREAEGFTYEYEGD